MYINFILKLYHIHIYIYIYIYIYRNQLPYPCQPTSQPTSQPANQPTSQPPPPPATSHQHQGGGSVSYRANGVKTIFTARKFFACSTKSMVFRRYWLKKRLQKSCCGAVWALEIRSKLTCFFLAFSNSPFIFPRGARRLFAYFGQLCLVSGGPCCLCWVGGFA